MDGSEKHACTCMYIEVMTFVYNREYATAIGTECVSKLDHIGLSSYGVMHNNQIHNSTKLRDLCLRL